MFLYDIVLLAVAFGLLCGLSLGLANVAKPPAHLVGGVAAAAFMIVMLCFRSLQFGVDTITYVDIFSDYCSSGRVFDREFSFEATAQLLNFTMLGSCEPNLLPSVWIFLIVLPVLFFRSSWHVRFYYLGTLLLSLVGIELATNALRQGLSVGVIVLGVSLAPVSLYLTIAFGALAMLLHPSAGLVLVAYMLARQRWKFFIIYFGGLFLLTIASLHSSSELPFVSRFIYEINKYLAHDNDEIWIRILAFACVIAALAAPMLVRRKSVSRRDLLKQRSYAIAVRLAIICMPFLALPYFGYRFIYGMYPVIMFVTLSPTLYQFCNPRKQFLWLMFFNVVLLLAWATGSVYMRDLPFFGS